MSQTEYLNKNAKIHRVTTLETASKLHEAGLQSSWGAGDWGYLTDAKMVGMGLADKAIFLGVFKDVFEYLYEVNRGNTVIKAYRLDQLLEEIEKRGYGYSLFFKAGRTGIPPYEMHMWAEGFPQKVFLATDCDEAVAKALLWILGRDRD